VARWIERLALGAVMGAVAFIAERRLVKAIRRRDQKADQAPRRRSGRHDLELALPSEEVDDQASG
jgi:flagellar biosynthesis/type III secretory pathway M-ring protein FliF/YscJ